MGGDLCIFRSKI